MSEMTKQEAIELREKWFSEGDSKYEVVTGKTEYYRTQCLREIEIENELKIQSLQKQNETMREAIAFTLMNSTGMNDKAKFKMEEALEKVKEIKS